MGKQTDRVFHLTVTVLALTLTAVSVGTLAYQHNPNVFRRILSPYVALNQSQTDHQPKKVPDTARNTKNEGGPSASKPIGSKTETNPGTQPGTKTGTQPGAAQNSDLALEPQYKMTDNDMLISVKPSASDVTAAEISQTEQLLSKYKIVDTVSQTLQMNIYQQVNIVLCKTQTDYKNELASLGVSQDDAQRYTMDTGGFTQGDTVVIPLYQNQSQSDYANTLGHELTHAFLNFNVGDFPSWMNEGLAVTDGMHLQSDVENPVAYQGYARQMAEDVMGAAKSGSLWPLASDESKVLSGNASYDLELQDWLAVRDLIQQHGTQSFADYFYRLKLGEVEATAFKRSFGTSESAFNQTMTTDFTAAAKGADSGVSLTFQVPSGFQGTIRMLQHGTQNWIGFRPRPGTVQVSVSADGKLTGAEHPTTPIQDSNPPDAATLYVNIDSDTPLTYQGQKVQNAGFAIDYHYGLYGFVNAWITLDGGKSVYLNTPSLFGIQLTNITEQEPSAWLTPLLGFSGPAQG